MRGYKNDGQEFNKDGNWEQHQLSTDNINNDASLGAWPNIDNGNVEHDKYAKHTTDTVKEVR